MTNNIITNISVVEEIGAIFATALETEYLPLDNYKYLDFVVSTGAGTSADTTVTVLGKLGEDGQPSSVPFRIKTGSCEYVSVDNNATTLTIGGTAGNCGCGIYRVTADNLAKQGFDRVALCCTAVSSSTVEGSVLAVQYEPRYTD